MWNLAFNRFIYRLFRLFFIRRSSRKKVIWNNSNWKSRLFLSVPIYMTSFQVFPSKIIFVILKSLFEMLTLILKFDRVIERVLLANNLHQFACQSFRSCYSLNDFTALFSIQPNAAFSIRFLIHFKRIVGNIRKWIVSTEGFVDESMENERASGTDRKGEKHTKLNRFITWWWWWYDLNLWTLWTLWKLKYSLLYQFEGFKHANANFRIQKT